MKLEISTPFKTVDVSVVETVGTSVVETVGTSVGELSLPPQDAKTANAAGKINSFIRCDFLLPGLEHVLRWVFLESSTREQFNEPTS